MMIFRKTYYGGSLKYPVTITQSFWDKVTAKRKALEEFNSRPLSEIGFQRVDTTLGSGELGERPNIPDWIYLAVKIIILVMSFISAGFMLAVFRRVY